MEKAALLNPRTHTVYLSTYLYPSLLLILLAAYIEANCFFFSLSYNIPKGWFFFSYLHLGVLQGVAANNPKKKKKKKAVGGALKKIIITKKLERVSNECLMRAAVPADRLVQVLTPSCSGVQITSSPLSSTFSPSPTVCLIESYCSIVWFLRDPPANDELDSRIFGGRFLSNWFRGFWTDLILSPVRFTGNF